jgi:LCP family protein required for cell wall assembly
LAFIALVGLIILIAGGGFAYLQYTWSHVKTDHCSNCAPVTAGKPYNVLVIGSDTRAGETQAERQNFGSASVEAGQRSDTIKIIRVDPAAQRADVLSIPRDTFVQMSGAPASSGLDADQKINASFNDGPKGLIDTIENTFGIPINDFVIVNFNGLQDAVGSLGGVSMDFPYPARDWDCETGTCNNQSGLTIDHAGCQTLNGPEALALSRSRHYPVLPRRRVEE